MSKGDRHRSISKAFLDAPYWELLELRRKQEKERQAETHLAKTKKPCPKTRNNSQTS